MSKAKIVSLAAAVLAAITVGAQAAPAVSPGKDVAAGVGTMVTEVQYYRRGGGYYRGGGYGRGWGGWGPGIGLGIGAGLVAGAIIADRAYRPRAGYYYDEYEYEGPYYYPSDYRGDPRRLCAQNFRSFEWNTGLYTTYGGEKRVCPYLR